MIADEAPAIEYCPLRNVDDVFFPKRCNLVAHVGVLPVFFNQETNPAYTPERFKVPVRTNDGAQSSKPIDREVVGAV